MSKESGKGKSKEQSGKNPRVKKEPIKDLEPKEGKDVKGGLLRQRKI